MGWVNQQKIQILLHEKDYLFSFHLKAINKLESNIIFLILNLQWGVGHFLLTNYHEAVIFNSKSGVKSLGTDKNPGFFYCMISIFTLKLELKFYLQDNPFLNNVGSKAPVNLI